MIGISELKQSAATFFQKMFLSHEVIFDFALLPLYQFRVEEVSYVFYTTNNMIRTPMGYFRYCWKHEPYRVHKQHMIDYYDEIHLAANNYEKGKRTFVNKEMAYWRSHKRAVQYQTYNAGKMMAEETIAALFGVERIMTHTHFCRLQIGDGEEMVGTMMSDAGGVDVRCFKDNYKEVFTPQLVCDLDNLNILDAVCHEKDHRPGNYHLLLDEKGNVVSICSFDNDSPWSFSPFGKINFKTYEKASFLIKDNEINRPCIDEDMANRVLGLKKQQLQEKLSPYLNRCQLNACWKRVHKLQRTLENSCNSFRKREDWNEDVVNQELSGRYGRTYLVILCDLYNRINKE